MFLNQVLLVTLVNFLLNVAIQTSIIFITLFGAQMGASNFQVGIIGAAYGGALLLSSLYSGQLSDVWGRTGFVRVGLFLCTGAFFMQVFSHQLMNLILVRGLVGLTLGIALASLVAYAFEAGADMGVFSSYGSLGWIVGAGLSMFLREFQTLFMVSTFCCGLAFILSLFFKAKKSMPTVETTKHTPQMRQVFKKGFYIYFAVFLRHLGATSVWIILPLYFTSLGMDHFWIALLWAINFLAQFVVMRFLEKYDARKVFAWGQILSIGVFLAYVFISNRYQLIVVQSMLGIAWGCLYVGALLLVLRTGEDRGTASGIFHATLNFCNAIGPFIGGAIAQYWGYRGVMIFATLMGIAGMLVAVPKTNAKQQLMTK